MLKITALEQTIQQQMQTAKVPGLALAVTQGAHTIYADGFGVTSIETETPPVTPHTLFRIGMLTIPLTCIAILDSLPERSCQEFGKGKVNKSSRKDQR